MLSVALIVLGVGLLYLGGELLVRFASSLAARLGLSSLTIGLTVVAFGTSAPELAASLSAALSGSPAIAVGNVVGSNIANLGLILGLCALLAPIPSGGVVRREVPLVVLASTLPFLWFLNGGMGRLEGLTAVVMLLGYLVWMFRQAPQEGASTEAASQTRHPLWLTLLGILGGLVLLVLGAQTLVEGATTLARLWGVPERVIGLTLVAVGTSLPELASSLVAILRRETDMVLGNLIGSNLFNVLGILGVTSAVVPLALSIEALRPDLLVMLGVAALTFLFLVTRGRLVRWEGLVLLLGYVAYVLWLF